MTTDQQILQVARKHFVQNGFAGTRMQGIADEVGINKAMLHYYFRSKDKLYGEIVEQILSMMLPKFAGVLMSEGTFWKKVENLVTTYIDALNEHPEIPSFIMSELSQKRERFIVALQSKSQYFPAMQGFIMQMMDEMQKGNIRSIPPHQLMMSIMGLTVFPFMAKPVFCTLFEFPEADFSTMMEERKTIILDILKNALRTD